MFLLHTTHPLEIQILCEEFGDLLTIVNASILFKLHM